MSATYSAPNPCLVAILLICQTRTGSGPQLVFHWPPEPSSQRTAQAAADEIDEQDNDSSDDLEDWSTDDDFYDLRATGKIGTDITSSGGEGPSKAHRGQADQKAGSTMPEVRTLLGLDEDGLVGLLTPDRAWNKRKFELSINDLTFVGRPIFAWHHGSWQRQKKTKLPKQRSTSSSDNQESSDDIEQLTSVSDLNNDGKEKVAPAEVKSELTMFHVVFVMSTPPLEHTFRVKEMYDNVIKKFSRALRWVQSHRDYVWQQAKSLLNKRQQLSSEISMPMPLSEVAAALLDTSSLSKAIADTFTSISASRIAQVSLIKGVSISMQIPPVTSAAYLPSLTDPPIPLGLWLTTATEAQPESASTERQSTSTTVQLAKSYTLLLKSPPAKIAKDAQAAGGPIAIHLPKFVAALRPTKSFYKLSNEHRISLLDIQLLARHLVYWRRAIAIPPLNQRDTYIVSPNADFRKLAAACKSYEAQFPASLPSLPKLLSFLSGIPRPYGTIIPSPDHKEIFMLVLAWLMRNGLVTQLRTFAYIRVGSDMKTQARDRDRDSRTSVSQSFNNNGEANDRPRPSFASRQSSDGRQSLYEAKGLKAASLIKSPPRASPEESRWMTHIHESILDGEGVFAALSQDERQELYQYWPVLSKYFDGNNALETVPIKEGLKRKLAWTLYGRMGLYFDGGVEDENGSNKSVIVTVRHW